MVIQIDNIANKYTTKLKKNYLNFVRYSDAVTNIQSAVEETANFANKELNSALDRAKEDIKQAIEPLKTKIAQKDEFISFQKQENEMLKNDINKKDEFILVQKQENNSLKTENQGLSTELEAAKKENSVLEDLIDVKDEFISSQKYAIDKINKENSSLKDEIFSLKTKENINKPIIKEAYKQNLTQDIREKKSILSLILSGLIRKKEEQNIPNVIEDNAKFPSEVTEQSVKLQNKTAVALQVEQPQKPLISKKIIRKIETQRVNQKIEKERIDKASRIIEFILKKAPVSGHNEMQEYFNKIKKSYLSQTDGMVARSEFVKKDFSDYKIDYGRYGNVIRETRGSLYKGNDFHPYEYKVFNNDNSSINIYGGASAPYIKWTDANNKDFLEIKFNLGKGYTVFFSDEKGRLVVTKSIENGVTKYLSVRFPDVQRIPEIVNDAPMNRYAESVINSSKENCIKQTSDYRDTTDIYYKDINGKTVVQEYKVRKHPVFFFFFNTKIPRFYFVF